MNYYGQEFIQRAESHLEEHYILGAKADLDDPHYQGPWDCAEFVTYIVYQVTGIKYGYKQRECYTGYWKEDLDKGKIRSIEIEDAINTVGAILLRYPNTHTEKPEGHIAFSRGDGKTIEAMDSKHGVHEGKAGGRIWDIGILLPDVQYT